MTCPAAPRRGIVGSWPAWLAVVGICLAVYGRVLGFGWMDWDDDTHVTRNPGLNPVTLPSVVEFWSRPYEGLYIPVSYTLFAAESAASRALVPAAPPAPPDPRLFHAVSILLHVACVLLVGRLLALRVATGWPAVAGMLLFALHPLQVESVAWISEQRGLLATALGLAALCLASRRDRPQHFGIRDFLSLACFALALLAKPSATVVPLVLAILNGAGDWRQTMAAAGRAWPWFVIAVVVSVVTKTQQPDEWSRDGIAVTPILRPLIAGDAVCFYTEKLLIPLGLCLDYGRYPGLVLANRWLCARAVLALVVLGAVCLTPRLRVARIPLGVGVVALLPVLGLVPFTFQGFSTVADRYMYLPMLGPALALALTVRWLSDGRRRAAIVGIAAWLVALTGLTLLQLPVWRDATALNTQIVRVNPRSAGGHLGLAAVLLADGRLQEAADTLRAAVAADPTYVKPRYELASTLHKLGERAEAEEQYREVIRQRPRWSYAHNDLGILLAEQGRLDEAIEHFREAVALRPDLEAQRDNLRRAEAERPRSRAATSLSP
jgi:protein O-mannosyl-transferase